MIVVYACLGSRRNETSEIYLVYVLCVTIKRTEIHETSNKTKTFSSMSKFGGSWGLKAVLCRSCAKYTLTLLIRSFVLHHFLPSNPIYHQLFSYTCIII